MNWDDDSINEFNAQWKQLYDLVGAADPAGVINFVTRLLKPPPNGATVPLFLRIDPLKARLYLARGDAYCVEGRIDIAMHDYRRAMELSPLEPFSYLGIAHIFELRNQMHLARRYYNLAVKCPAFKALSHVERGVFYLHKRSISIADADFSAALLLAPQHSVAKMLKTVCSYLERKLRQKRGVNGGTAVP